MHHRQVGIASILLSMMSSLTPSVHQTIPN